MELIKKHCQSIISYGIILFGVIALIAILIVKPSRTILENAYIYKQKPEPTYEFRFYDEQHFAASVLITQLLEPRLLELPQLPSSSYDE